VPVSSFKPNKSALLLHIEECFSGVTVIETLRKQYNEQMGHEYIQRLACAEDLIAMLTVIPEKYYAVSAAAAVLNHVELNYKIFAHNTLRMKYEGSDGRIGIYSFSFCLAFFYENQEGFAIDSLPGLLAAAFYNGDGDDGNG
jgi:DNA mismatch repair protein MSH4